MKTDFSLTKQEFDRIINYALVNFPEFNKEYNEMLKVMPYLIRQKYDEFECFDFYDLQATACLMQGYLTDKIFAFKKNNITYKLVAKTLNKNMINNLKRDIDFEVLVLSVEDENTQQEKNLYINISKKDEKTCFVERIVEVDNTNTFEIISRKYKNDLSLSFKEVEEIFGTDKTESLNV